MAAPRTARSRLARLGRHLSAPAAPTAPAAATHRQAHREAKPEVIFETDGRHSSVYVYEPPMGVRRYVEPIDEVLDLGVDTISYAIGDCRYQHTPLTLPPSPHPPPVSGWCGLGGRVVCAGFHPASTTDPC